MNNIDKSLSAGFKTLLDPPADDLITTDEWNHARYVIRKTLRTCEDEEINKIFRPGNIPFLGWFKRAIECRLIGAGFDKKSIKNEIWFKGLIHTIDSEQGLISSGRWDLNPPFGFPAGTYTLSDDNHQMWIKPDIEAALLTLQSLKKLDELVVKDGTVNIEALKVFLRSFELTINLLRAGKVSELAISEVEKREKSIDKRELKKEVMRRLIESIFKKNPHRPKTLGEVWNKFDTGEISIRFIETKKEYIGKTGKIKGKDVVFITGDVTKPFTYAKRSLQRFIDQLK